jgi:glycosyltransferase involved in cell wall biosynthesis
MSDRAASASPSLLQVFNRYLVPGGEEMAVREYARILGAEGRFDECIFDSAEWTGPGAPPAWKQAAWTFYNPAAVRRLREKQNLLQARAWIVHNVLPVGSTGIYSEALRQNIPLIQLIHNFRPFSVTGYGWAGGQLDAACWPRNYLREIAHGAWQDSRWKTAFLACVLSSMHLRRQFRAVKSWIAISDFMRRQFIAAGVPQARVFRLYHSWDIKNREASIPEGDYYLFLGRLMEAKGVKILAAAWDILARQSGAPSPRLVFAGQGPLEDWVKAAQARQPRIEFRGYVGGEEKHRLIAGCRAIVQPAIWAEPLSLVIYEAYDYGKPVLVAASGGMPELVSADTGLVHTPGVAEELAAQVRQMEGLSSLERQKMGQAGRRWLLENTGRATWKKQFFAIVEHALAPAS